MFDNIKQIIAKQERENYHLNQQEIFTANKLLASAAQKKNTQAILKQMAFSPEESQQLIWPVLQKTADMVQHLPASEHGLYQEKGGWLQLILARSAAATALMNQYTPQRDDQNNLQADKLWQYMIFTASMLFDLGKLVTDYEISILGKGKPHKWSPFMESMSALGKKYSYRFLEPTPSYLQHPATTLIAQSIIPVKGMAWLTENNDKFLLWLGMLSENDNTVPFYQLMLCADAIAKSQYLDKLSQQRVTARHQLTFEKKPVEYAPWEDEKVGMVFIGWVKKKLQNKELMLNEPPLLFVPGGLLLTHDIFHLFIQEYPNYKNWLATQMAFEKLGLHDVGPYNEIKNQFLRQYAIVVRAPDLPGSPAIPMFTFRNVLNNEVFRGMLIRNPYFFLKSVNLSQHRFGAKRSLLTQKQLLKAYPADEQVVPLIPQLQAAYEPVPTPHKHLQMVHTGYDGQGHFSYQMKEKKI